MTSFVFSNFAVSTLSTAIAPSAVQLQLNVDDVGRFPLLAEGTKFPLVLADSDDNIEIIYVTALSDSGLASIERGREGTVAQSWLAGTLLRHTFTAGTVSGLGGFNPRGAWAAPTSYAPRDVVTHDGVAYVAVNASVTSVPSGTNPNWQVIYQPPNITSTVMNFQGRWASTITYSKGAVVEYRGRQWQSLADNNLNNAPANGSLWVHFSPWSGAARHNSVLAFSGTNNYTVNIPTADAPLSLYDGLTIRGRFANTNTAGATLAINALAPVALRPRSGVTMAPGDIIAGELYEFTYVAATAEFLAARIVGLGTLAKGVTPIGTIVSYGGNTAPAGWLLCHGQEISRITYAALFAVIGGNFGAGDSFFTFNVPDLRGRVPVGLDNMGGSAAGRIPGWTAMSQSLGSWLHQISIAELPAHTHVVTDPGHNHTITDPGHIHAITDPGHTHSFNDINANNDGPNGTGSGAKLTTVTTASATASATTGISVNSRTTGISLASQTTGITLQNTGSGTAYNNMQPSTAVNMIIYAGV